MPSLSAEPTATQGRTRAAHLGPERRRPQLLDAALGLFVRHGYKSTTMEAIAGEAGVTKPVVYECFTSKEDLFGALLEREEQRLFEAVLGSLPAEPRFDGLEGLLADGLGALLSAAAAHPDSWRVVFLSEHGAEPEIAKRVGRGRAIVVQRMQEMTHAFLAQQGSEEIERKAAVLAEIMTSIGEAAVRVLLAPGSDWKPDELAAFVARVSANGPAAA